MLCSDRVAGIFTTIRANKMRAVYVCGGKGGANSLFEALSLATGVAGGVQQLILDVGKFCAPTTRKHTPDCFLEGKLSSWGPEFLLNTK